MPVNQLEARCMAYEEEVRVFATRTKDSSGRMASQTRGAAKLGGIKDRSAESFRSPSRE